MRISDWSSDVCSSDLSFNYTKSNANYPSVVAGSTYSLEGLSKYSYSLVGYYEKYGIQARVAYTYRDDFLQVAVGRNSEQEYFNGYGQLDASLSYRSEEHTSELQSLMRISYAVFCLKKKK